MQRGCRPTTRPDQCLVVSGRPCRRAPVVLVSTVEYLMLTTVPALSAFRGPGAHELG